MSRYPDDQWNRGGGGGRTFGSRTNELGSSGREATDDKTFGFTSGSGGRNNIEEKPSFGRNRPFDDFENDGQGGSRSRFGNPDGESRTFGHRDRSERDDGSSFAYRREWPPRTENDRNHGESRQGFGSHSSSFGRDRDTGIDSGSNDRNRGFRGEERGFNDSRGRFGSERDYDHGRDNRGPPKNDFKNGSSDRDQAGSGFGARRGDSNSYNNRSNDFGSRARDDRDQSNSGSGPFRDREGGSRGGRNSGFDGGHDGSFGGNRDGRFDGNRNSEFGGNRGNGFGGNRDGGFGGNRDDGFGDRRAGGFGGNRGEGFIEKSESGFSGSRGGGFGGGRGGGFGGSRGGGFGGSRGGGFDGDRGGGFANDRGGNFGGGRGGGFGANRDGGYDGGGSRRGEGFDSDRRGGRGGGFGSGFSNRDDKDGFGFRKTFSNTGGFDDNGRGGGYRSTYEVVRGGHGNAVNIERAPRGWEPDEVNCDDVFGQDREMSQVLDYSEDVAVNVEGAEDNRFETWENSPLRSEIIDILISKCKFTRPRPIQAASITHILQGRDVIGHVETGAGKTLAFVLPIIQKILESPNRYNAYKPTCIVLTPTRELASQTYESFVKFGLDLGLKIVLSYGQMNRYSALDKMQSGCDVYIGTLGRLKDFLEKGEVVLSGLRFLVIDEADEMLRLDRHHEIECLLKNREFKETDKQRQTLLFTATKPDEFLRIAKDLTKNCVTITSGGRHTANHRVKQEYVNVRGRPGKLDKLFEIFGEEAASGQTLKTLIFVETKKTSDWLAMQLISKKWKAKSINGDRPQNERIETFESFKKGHLDVLVGTDVCARGWDVPNLERVINFDLPTLKEGGMEGAVDNFVHRIGRTGRIKNGIAITFVDPMIESDRRFAPYLQKIASAVNQSVPDWLIEAESQTGGFSSSSNGFGSGGGGFGSGGGGFGSGTGFGGSKFESSSGFGNAGGFGFAKASKDGNEDEDEWAKPKPKTNKFDDDEDEEELNKKQENSEDAASAREDKSEKEWSPRQTQGTESSTVEEVEDEAEVEW